MKDSGTKAASRALGDVAEMMLKYQPRVRDRILACIHSAVWGTDLHVVATQ